MKVNNDPKRFRRRLESVAERLEKAIQKGGSEAQQVRRREELNKVLERLNRGY